MSRDPIGTHRKVKEESVESKAQGHRISVEQQNRLKMPITNIEIGPQGDITNLGPPDRSPFIQRRHKDTTGSYHLHLYLVYTLFFILGFTF